LELPALLKLLLGRWAEYLTLLFSMLALVGACIAYYILMTNFLFSMIKFIDGEISRSADASEWRNYTVPNVICPSLNSTNASQVFVESETESTFDKFWTLNLTAPLALLVFVFPLMNVRSPSFFMKFNALGTLSVVFIGVFIGVKVGEWGFNFDLTNPDSPLFVELFDWDSAHILSGILALALFSHNVIITLMSTQKEPENNGRDLSIAYVCVTLTYCLVGVPFWLGFPLPKFCIEDNFLNNFSGNDVLAAVARCFLLFQLTTVFPLLTYVIRTQFMFMMFETTYPGFWHVLLLNVLLAFVCLMFTMFLPQIGTIIR
jgi:sodium-coupled neutral amino acid transporter 9